MMVLPEATWTVTLFFPSLWNVCEMLPSKVIIGWISKGEKNTESFTGIESASSRLNIEYALCVALDIVHNEGGRCGKHNERDK